MKKGMSLLMSAVLLLLVQTSLFALEWSGDQGQMNWNNAKAKCSSLKMRLPTKGELIDASKSGLAKGWDHKGDHWSSEATASGTYTVNMWDGNTFNTAQYDANTYVRCVR